MKRPTLETVAAAAGVGRGTVSRVVNGSSQVSEQTVKTVNDAIKRLGYVPNRAARSLASNRTMAIALIVPENAERFLDDPYLAAVVRGIYARLEESEYVLTLFVASADPTRKTLRYLRGGNVDGAIIVSQHERDNYLLELGEIMPIVFNGKPNEAGTPPHYYVDVDNEAAALEATEYLIASGRRSIAHVAGPTDMPAAHERVLGWQSALERAGLDAGAIEHGDYTAAGGARAMRLLLEKHPDLDAIFAANDLMAMGAIGVLLDAGRAVPGDVAVVGFDNSSAALSARIPLTTISQPAMDSGRTAADVLLRVLAGESPERASILPTSLVQRDSA